MTTIRECIDGFQERLRTIDHLKVPKRIPDTIDADCAVVKYAGTNFDSTMSRGTDDLTFVIQIFTSKASDRGQDALWAYCDGSGDRSIKVAIEADPTLGDRVQFAVVTEVQEPGTAEVADVEFYSAEIIAVVSLVP